MRKRAQGVTLIELLCVLVIISILASMLLPAVMKAYRRAKDMCDEFEAPEAVKLIEEQTRSYCVSHPKFRFKDKADFTRQCAFSPKCGDWVRSSAVVFVPFSWEDATNKVVLTVLLGRKKEPQYIFTKGDLTTVPEQ